MFWERFFVFSSPIVFALCMIPFFHAWIVQSQANYIEKTFKKAINASNGLFDDYAEYTKKRVADYQSYLLAVKDNRQIDQESYEEIGFSDDSEDNNHLIDLETGILRRQLLAQYDTVKTEAKRWIARANQKTSVWNVFLVGNIREIQSSFISWDEQLTSFSTKILSTESSDIRPFAYDPEKKDEVIKGLSRLAALYQGNEFYVLPITGLQAVILYFMFLFPYFIQKRNGVSTYTLFGRRFMNDGISMSDPISKKNEPKPHDVDFISPFPEGIDDETDDEREKRKRRRRGMETYGDSRKEKSNRRNEDQEEDSIIQSIDNIN